jgi:hypothetical protein
MESGELMKEIMWAVVGAVHAYRFWAAIALGVIGYFVIPFLPTKPADAAAPTQATIQQRSEGDSSCTNIVASGDGKVNCSSTKEEKLGANPPKTP